MMSELRSDTEGREDVKNPSNSSPNSIVEKNGTHLDFRSADMSDGDISDERAESGRRSAESNDKSAESVDRRDESSVRSDGSGVIIAETGSETDEIAGSYDVIDRSAAGLDRVSSTEERYESWNAPGGTTFRSGTEYGNFTEKSAESGDIIYHDSAESGSMNDKSVTNQKLHHHLPDVSSLIKYA